MFHSELNNFLVKFHQLWQAGQPAHLNVDCRDGYAWCGLRVQLGPAPGHHQQDHQQVRRGRPKRSPASYRRLERRKAARAAAAEDAPSSSPPDATAEEAIAEVLLEENGQKTEATEEAAEDDAEAEEATATEPEKDDMPVDVPKMYMDELKPYEKFHGNVKLVVSDQLLSVINPGCDPSEQSGQKFTLSEIVKRLWAYISEKGNVQNDFFTTDATLAGVFPMKKKFQFREFKYYLQHHVYFSKTHVSVYSWTPHKLPAAGTTFLDTIVSFKNVS